MTTRAAIVSVLIVAVILLGATMLSRLLSFQSQPNAVPTESLSLTPPEPPMTILISCERGNRSGWASYGGVDIPEGAISVRCKPDELFAYDVSSTDTELAESRRRPEIAFALSGSGQVEEAMISRSSGSRALDAKVLALVTNTRYKATGCGSCRVAARVAADMKKRYP